MFAVLSFSLADYLFVAFVILLRRAFFIFLFLFGWLQVKKNLIKSNSCRSDLISRSFADSRAYCSLYHIHSLGKATTNNKRINGKERHLYLYI